MLQRHPYHVLPHHIQADFWPGFSELKGTVFTHGCYCIKKYFTTKCKNIDYQALRFEILLQFNFKTTKNKNLVL